MTADWLTARDVRAMFGKDFHFSGADKTIAKRAHAGLIRTKASRLVIRGQASEPEVHDDAALPPGFWWAEGEANLEQNWETGDFSTWIDDSVKILLVKREWQALSVQFHRADIDATFPLLRGPPAATTKVPKEKADAPPRLPEAKLNAWWESLGPVRDSLSILKLLQMVREEFPRNYISRERIRKLAPNRKPGPKQIGQKETA